MVTDIKLDHDTKPRLKPLLHERTKGLLKQKDLLFSLIDGIGSPLNIIIPQNIEDNIKSFQDAYKRNHIRGRIYYTTKPCKSDALLRHASLFDVGVDVSSLRSLQGAVGCGFSPDRVEATGPKNVNYILTCLQLGVTINADNMEELKTILQLQKSIGLTRKARVFVRLCGFHSERIGFTPQDNTFGIPVRDAGELIDWLVQHQDTIDFAGFSHHFGTNSIEQKKVAIENQLELTFAAIKKGLKPKGLNIGGSMNIRYVETAEEWQEYQYLLKQSIIDEIPNQTWNKSGLGYRNDNGVVSGGPQFSEHYYAKTKGDDLDQILNTRLTGFNNSHIKSIIGDSLLELYIEPGKGMVDQCGITIGRVNFTKRSDWDELLVNVDINQTNINATQVRNLTESLIIPRSDKRLQNTEGIYYYGNLCTFHDILQFNKQYPDIIPERGDLVCFANTAPYAMDFNESETLKQPIATKVALYQRDDVWKWALDSQYNPLEQE
jgi:diaminopimelate decarboxylase